MLADMSSLSLFVVHRSTSSGPLCECFWGLHGSSGRILGNCRAQEVAQFVCWASCFRSWEKREQNRSEQGQNWTAPLRIQDVWWAECVSVCVFFFFFLFVRLCCVSTLRKSAWRERACVCSRCFRVGFFEFGVFVCLSSLNV